MKVSEITKKEVKYTKKVFKYLDEAVELMYTKENDLPNEDIEDRIRYRVKDIAAAFAWLSDYELDYEAFKKYIDDSRYIELLDRAYEYGKDIYEVRSHLRLADKKPGPERSAKKQLKKLYKGIKSDPNSIIRAFVTDGEYKTAEELTYILRDWMIYGVNELIDVIEPARQEFIVTKRGNVEEEEVEEYLLSKFPPYELYIVWVTHRRVYEISYYPDLKLD